MPKYLLLFFMLLVAPISGFCSDQWPGFEGAWFWVTYPPDFSVRDGLPSSSGEGVDSAWFISPDQSVAFYVYASQWGGEPGDFWDQTGEIVVSEKKTGGPEEDQETTWTTKRATDGSYWKSLVNKREYTATWAIGIKYKNEAAYGRHKERYLRFRNSLEQFADN